MDRIGKAEGGGGEEGNAGADAVEPRLVEEKDDGNFVGDDKAFPANCTSRSTMMSAASFVIHLASFQNGFRALRGNGDWGVALSGDLLWLLLLPILNADFLVVLHSLLHIGGKGNGGRSWDCCTVISFITS